MLAPSQDVMSDDQSTSEGPADLKAAGRIAGDLALALHQGLIISGETLPTHEHLMNSYEVTGATVTAAMAKLHAAALIRRKDATDVWRAVSWHEPGIPALELMHASSMCRSLAAHNFNSKYGPPKLEVGGDPEWGTAAEKKSSRPPRSLDVSILASLDRNLLRWMGDSFLEGARRLVADGQTPADTQLLAAARSLLLRAGAREEGQHPIAHLPGPPNHADENVVGRIWPERRAYREDLAPF